MKRFYINPAIALVFIAAVFMTACSASKTATTAKSGAASLLYKMEAPAGYTYEQSSTTEQYMDVQGQSVAVSSKTLLGFKATNAGTGRDGNLDFDVVLDTGAVVVASMMEDMSTDLNLKGKSFRMVMKSNGENISLGEASNIEISAETAGVSDLGAMFTGMFPKFHRSDIQPGDTWPSVDTLVVKSSTVETTTIGRSNNTFTQFATINGRKCVQIDSEVAGTRVGKMNSQGMDMLMSFPYSGTETIFFDSEEGVVVKYESHVKGSGSVEIVGMGMTIPVDMDSKVTLELKK